VTSKRTAITGNPAEDVLNPVFKEVEEVGLSWLRKVYGPSSVLDRRSRNVYFDAEVYLGSENLQKLDFKADQNFVRTGNLAWEDTIEYQSGQVVDGWGRKDLDLIFYIDPVTYTGILVRGEKANPFGQQFERKYPCLPRSKSGCQRRYWFYGTD
jgi:hypothetical protein